MSKYRVGSEEWHCELDRKVMSLEGVNKNRRAAAISGLDSDPNAGDIIYALQSIVNTAPKPLWRKDIVWDDTETGYKKQYRALNGVVLNSPNLEEAVENAWKMKSFKSLRQRPDLLRSSEEVSGSKPVVDTTTAKIAVKKAWEHAFVGKTHQLLHRAINDMNYKRDNIPYANYLAIIQSSGMGKSRTVDELSKIVFTLPFNLRPSDETANGYAYPLPDDDVRGYLKGNGAVHPHKTMTNFFAALFQEVNDELGKQRFKILRATDAKLADEWYKYLKETEHDNIPNRTLLYRRVVKRATQVEGETRLPLLKNAQELEKSVTSFFPVEKDRKTVRILMYFDEAHVLADVNVDTVQEGSQKAVTSNLYQVLTSVLSDVAPCQIFYLTMSTNSHLGRFAPPAPLHPSARIQNAVGKLQTPFTELPFDLLENNVPFFTVGVTTVEDTFEIGYLAKFGRPLFYAQWKANKDAGIPDTAIIQLARAKLLRRNINIDSPAISTVNPTDDQKTMLLAMFSMRYHLEINPRRQRSRDIEQALVQGHMRVAYSIPAHGEYYRSGTPSEPLLAEAAAQEMNNISGIPNAVCDLLTDELIEKGQGGELVGRMLLTTAYDIAITASNPEKTGAWFSKPVKLFDFLKALLGPNNFSEHILPSRLEDCNETFESAFKDAYVRFTHWGRFGLRNKVTAYTSLAAFARAMAIQCYPNQKVIDFAIPIVFLDGKGFATTKLDYDLVSALLIQIKNKEDHEVIDINERELDDTGGFFHHLPTNKPAKPYIALTLHLGVKNEKKVGIEVPEGKKSTQKKSTKKNLRPKFAFEVIGFNGELYPLAANYIEAYRKLLSEGNLLTEHTRKDDEFLDAVRRLKPEWNANASCYNWFSKEGWPAVKSDN